jgi:hypothetical protein
VVLPSIIVVCVCMFVRYACLGEFSESWVSLPFWIGVEGVFQFALHSSAYKLSGTFSLTIEKVLLLDLFANFANRSRPLRREQSES